jgi:hypothetical protein
VAEKKRHERYDIPHADVLDEDVWADEDESVRALKCVECGAELGGSTTCPSCGTLAPMCSGVCGACSITPCEGRDKPGD